ncbi:sensor histidine kinase [Streptomyces sp. WM6378]|uniref:sensor histidine kinase n=1 Tax=Streptomyces sp. WM6378 TaxID=1415557 RepID=UPI0006B0691B|nr:sensor histidine kinase [Streptomyces sp. WM6378]KOU46862.1 histidine kinase [Streptomyces sp. WM6378]
MDLPSAARGVLRPFSESRRYIAFLVAGIPVQAVALLVIGVPWLTGGPSQALSVLIAILIPLVSLAFASPLLTAIQRRRFRGLGVELPLLASGQQGGTLRERATSWLQARMSLRQVQYHLLVGPLVALGAVLLMLLWLSGVGASTIYLWVWALPANWRMSDVGYSTQAAYVTVAGITAVYSAACLSIRLARCDIRMAMNLLRPTFAEQLVARVDELTQRRAAIIEATDAERRRIERDLHDGVQQRLVSLAVNLGMARVQLSDLPEDAWDVIDEAHREAKEAIVELSNLVRGLHPAVLEDRGLDAALSGIAGRVPIPVRLMVDLPSRPSPTIESAAYFVVSEALTNVVKHAEASRVDVTVERIGATLLVVIGDDGCGGADPSGGSGLIGLSKRVAAVDGGFSISSPVGGPTVITVELPCGS